MTACCQTPGSAVLPRVTLQQDIVCAQPDMDCGAICIPAAWGNTCIPAVQSTICIPSAWGNICILAAQGTICIPSAQGRTYIPPAWGNTCSSGHHLYPCSSVQHLHPCRSGHRPRQHQGSAASASPPRCITSTYQQLNKGMALSSSAVCDSDTGNEH